MSSLEAEKRDVKETNSRVEEELRAAKETIRKLEEDLQRVETPKIGPSAASASSEGDSMLSIVCGQRDRMKRRMAEMESDNRKLVDDVSRLEREVSSLQSDNVKLYERIRYVQTLPRLRGSSAASAAPQSSSESVDVESRYQQLYEAGAVNPFHEFSRSVKEEQLRALNPAERITLSASRWLLSHRHLRLILFLYVLALHLLVVIVLSRCASSSSSVSSPSVPPPAPPPQ